MIGKGASVAATLLALILSSCTGQQLPPDSGTTDIPSECACTASFGSISLLVQDAGGNPVTPDSVSITVKRTGEILEPMSYPPGVTAPGGVIIADDSDEVRKKISGEPDGDVLIVEIAAGNTTRSVEVTVGYDQPCRCHIQKLSGPDEVEMP